MSAASPRPPLARRSAAAVGRGLRSALGQTGAVGWLAWLALRHGLTLRRERLGVVLDQTKLQVRFTAWDALPLALLAALLLGGTAILQVYGQLSALGAERTLSRILAQLVIRELGPLMVGILVLARSGTAIAAEMASVRLSAEAAALSALGVNPVQYFLLPRLLGGVVSVFTLVVLVDASALLGGFAVAWLLRPLSLQAFLEALGEAIGGAELAVTALKALAFGTAIPLLCVAFGFRVRQSSTEIPQAVTRAAVVSLMALLLSSAFLSLVLYA